MKAHVLDVKDDLIYLQIENQIRFRSRYFCPDGTRGIIGDVDVDFHFIRRGGIPVVMIDRIRSDFFPTARP